MILSALGSKPIVFRELTEIEKNRLQLIHLCSIGLDFVETEHKKLTHDDKVKIALEELKHFD